MGHARDMSMHNDMTHTGSNGSSPADRASAVGYNWGSVAENVAEGQSSIAQVMNDWMHSPGHRANLLAGSSNDFAAAVAQALDGSLYWVQCFGSLL
ncbi:hypothetical protein BC828DRAFT_409547 [Blastocladiella britannica]|nr:hypothetical protein BC828DRAFT_409547 [Blastocladiella britannica]